jgi:hypothetical protein
MEGPLWRLLIPSRSINKHGHHRQFLFEKIFKNRPIRNKNCLWWPCLLMDRDEISNLYRGPSIDASYQVSVHLAEGFQRRRLKCEKLTDDGRQVHYVFSPDHYIGIVIASTILLYKYCAGTRLIDSSHFHCTVHCLFPTTTRAGDIVMVVIRWYYKICHNFMWYIPITYILCWYKTLYQVVPVVWAVSLQVAIAMVSSWDRQDPKQSLVPAQYLYNNIVLAMTMPI